MKELNRMVLRSNSSCHVTVSKRDPSGEPDTKRTPISGFWLLAEEDGGEWQFFTDGSNLEFPIFVTYTKKRGRIVIKDESASFNKGLLYWEEGDRTGNLLCFSQGDTDYDIIKVEAYGEEVRKLIHRTIKILSPVLIGRMMEDYAVQASLLKGGDADEGIEAETGA